LRSSSVAIASILAITAGHALSLRMNFKERVQALGRIGFH
jgi:hypothetical protein